MLNHLRFLKIKMFVLYSFLMMLITNATFGKWMGMNRMILIFWNTVLENMWQVMLDYVCRQTLSCTFTYAWKRIGNLFKHIFNKTTAYGDIQRSSVRVEDGECEGWGWVPGRVTLNCIRSNFTEHPAAVKSAGLASFSDTLVVKDFSNKIRCQDW